MKKVVWHKSFQPDFVYPLDEFMYDSSQHRNIDTLLSLSRKLERLVCLEFLPNPVGWQFAAISTERKRFFPRPKNDDAACIGETRRTSGCDNGNIPLGMENG